MEQAKAKSNLNKVYSDRGCNEVEPHLSASLWLRPFLESTPLPLPPPNTMTISRIVHATPKVACSMSNLDQRLEADPYWGWDPVVARRLKEVKRRGLWFSMPEPEQLAKEKEMYKEKFENPRFSRIWIAPTTFMSACVGGIVGGTFAAIARRPMQPAAFNVAFKFSVVGWAYMSSLAILSRDISPQFRAYRLPMHVANGLAWGLVWGWYSSGMAGLKPGLKFGLVGGLCAYFIMEGRHHVWKYSKDVYHGVQEKRRIQHEQDKLLFEDPVGFKYVPKKPEETKQS